RSGTRYWYRFHDLIRLYAAEKAAQEIPREEADAAVDRMLAEFHEAVRSAVAPPPSEPEEIRRAAGRRESASAYLNVDRLALIEAVELAHRTGHRHTAMELGADVGGYLFDTRRWLDAVRVLKAALESALELGDTEYEVMLRCKLASNLHLVERPQESMAHVMRALQIARELGHRGLEGAVLEHLGAEYSSQGNFEKAVACHRLVLQIVTETGDVPKQASQHCLIGNALEKGGDLDGAVASYNRALLLYRQAGRPVGIATTLRMLGSLYLTELRLYGLAFDHYAEAQAIYRDTGYRYDEADMWDMLGTTCLEAGEIQPAKLSWESALRLANHIAYRQLAEHVKRMLRSIEAHDEPP